MQMITIIKLVLHQPKKWVCALCLFSTSFDRLKTNVFILKVLKADPAISELLFVAEDKLCHCYLHLGEYSQSLEYCSLALSRHVEPRILCDRAEDQIALDMLDEAQQDYSKVRNTVQRFSFLDKDWKPILLIGPWNWRVVYSSQRRLAESSKATKTSQETRLLQNSWRQKECQ